MLVLECITVGALEDLLLRVANIPEPDTRKVVLDSQGQTFFTNKRRGRENQEIRNDSYHG